METLLNRGHRNGGLEEEGRRLRAAARVNVSENASRSTVYLTSGGSGPLKTGLCPTEDGGVGVEALGPEGVWEPEEAPGLGMRRLGPGLHTSTP